MASWDNISKLDNVIANLNAQIQTLKTMKSKVQGDPCAPA